VVNRIGFQFGALFLVLLYAGVFAYGQNDRATMTGTVADPTGAVMAGAHITLTEVATGLRITGTTNNDAGS
jgi:hypothetical protein